MLKPMFSNVALIRPLDSALPLELVLPVTPVRRWPEILLDRVVTWLYMKKWHLSCSIKGDHIIVRAKRINVLTNEVSEYHCGCVRCTFFWTEAPDGRQTSDPRMMGLE